MMESPSEKKGLSALEVNLARTSARVEIPAAHMVLLEVADGFYGVQRQTREFLEEWHHPFRNWGFALEQLKAVSFGHIAKQSRHKKWPEALKIILEIYLDISGKAPDVDVREKGIDYLFDYLKLCVSNLPERRDDYRDILIWVFETIINISEKEPMVVRKASRQWKVLLHELIQSGIKDCDPILCRLSISLFRSTYDFLLSQPDPNDWITNEDGNPAIVQFYRELIKQFSHEHIRWLRDSLLDLETVAKQTNLLQALTRFPDYSQIVNGYLRVADELEKLEISGKAGHLAKIKVLLNIINLPGLADIHGIALREINRSLSIIIKGEDKFPSTDLIRMVFTIIKGCTSRQKYLDTVFHCFTTIAKNVLATNDRFLFDAFVDELISFGFQYPEIKGATVDWQVEVNPGHVKNIRTWLEIIMMKPPWTKRLLSALIINLKLGGVFIRDTDLLQKDVSKLLNSSITHSYNLVKQLSRLFPIYFSEIGAEGELRDISTRVDELAQRRDKLIHFVRKQSHVESNSLLVTFLEHIFLFWQKGDKELVRSFLPPEVFDEISIDEEYFNNLHLIFTELATKFVDFPTVFLSWDIDKIKKEIATVPDVNDRDKERAFLMIRFYQLIHKKYNPQPIGLIEDLTASFLIDSKVIVNLTKAMRRKQLRRTITIILDILSNLKEIILDPMQSTAEANIYHKRHIAVGIPSMYGTYREKKFDALGLSLRLEILCTAFFEQLIESLNLRFITKSTLVKIHDLLWILVRSLELDGIAVEGLVAKMKYLTGAIRSNIFSIDQYLDIFTFISKSIQDVIRDYYLDTHGENLPIVIGQLIEKREDIDKGSSTERDEFTYQMSENFFRSMIASSFGLQTIDNFVTRVIHSLNAEREKFAKNPHVLNLLMTYDPDATVTPLHKRKKALDNQILLGNKGFFLKKLMSHGFPIPPGFIITTEVFRCDAAVAAYKYMSLDLNARIAKALEGLERITGRKYGDLNNPLLLSVRSGAAFSLPGMMNSILNVGINEEIAESLSRREDFSWAAWDCYRRFLQGWGMLKGLNRDFFDQIMNDQKQRFHKSKKIQFTPAQMKDTALAYREAMEEHGIEVVDDPTEQLRQAIVGVFASWHAPLARIYRNQMNISHEWGTAVIVQSMVFGNINERSGSGVIFTRDPKGVSSEFTLYGDFIFGVQGDDIVGGLVETYPISEKQRKSEQRLSDISLENTFPEIYEELVRLADKLINEMGFNHQEIEFTFERPKRDGLYILQTRDMVRIDTKPLKVFRDTEVLKRSFLGIGIGVGGGALSGRAVYSEEEIRAFRSSEPRTSLILIRPDTVPDDVTLILQVDGVLTARGGSTSHAAVTIPQLNKVGVVGFSKLRVFESSGYSIIDDKTIRSGDFISIDGWSGAVYIGHHEVEETRNPRYS